MKSAKEIARELGLIRKRSSKSCKSTNISGQIFQYLIVIDFESTCWEEDKYKSQEIIEFPAVLLNLRNGQIEDEFRYYVQPQEYPILSSFCTKLTGITQDQVDDGVPLFLCLRKFQAWIQKMQLVHNFTLLNYLNSPFKGAFVTWSDWDLGRCLDNECRRKQLHKPIELNSWIDLRATYRKFYNRKPQGLKGALQEVGFKFEGREHSGLDDAKNTAFLAYQMIKDGCLLLLTKIDTNIRQKKQTSIKIPTCSENILNNIENTHPNIINSFENVEKNVRNIVADNLNTLNILIEDGKNNINNNINNNESNNTTSCNLKIKSSQLINGINGKVNGECINDLELMIQDEWFNNDGLIWDEKSNSEKYTQGTSLCDNIRDNCDSHFKANIKKLTDRHCLKLLNMQSSNQSKNIEEINNLQFRILTDVESAIINDKNIDDLNEDILIGLQEELDTSFNHSYSVVNNDFKKQSFNQSNFKLNDESTIDNETFNQSFNELLTANIDVIFNDSFNSTITSPPAKKEKSSNTPIRLQSLSNNNLQEYSNQNILNEVNKNFNYNKTGFFNTNIKDNKTENREEFKHTLNSNMNIISTCIGSRFINNSTLINNVLDTVKIINSNPTKVVTNIVPAITSINNHKDSFNDLNFTNINNIIGSKENDTDIFLNTSVQNISKNNQRFYNNHSMNSPLLNILETSINSNQDNCKQKAFNTPIQNYFKDYANSKSFITPVQDSVHKTPLQSNVNSSLNRSDKLLDCFITHNQSNINSGYKNLVGKFGRTPPLCKCGHRTHRRAVQNSGPNNGKYFYSCSKTGKKGCGYFQWESTNHFSSLEVKSATGTNQKSCPGDILSADNLNLSLNNFQLKKSNTIMNNFTGSISNLIHCANISTVNNNKIMNSPCCLNEQLVSSNNNRNADKLKNNANNKLYKNWSSEEIIFNESWMFEIPENIDEGFIELNIPRSPVLLSSWYGQ